MPDDIPAHIVYIPRVTEEDVLYGIATLSGFTRDAYFKSISPGLWSRDRSLVAWHQDIVDKFGGDFSQIALTGPDIAVTEIAQQKEPWLTGSYRVFLSQRFDPGVLMDLEACIREDRAKPRIGFRQLGGRT